MQGDLIIPQHKCHTPRPSSDGPSDGSGYNQRAPVDADRNGTIFDPIAAGTSDTKASATAQVTRLAEQYRLSDPNLSVEKAIAKAYEENPDLYISSLK